MSAVHPMSVTFPDSPLPDVPVDAELRFDTALPYAACLAFPLSSSGCSCDDFRLCWYFSRDLLDEGRHAQVGRGDVRVGPGAEGEVFITLQSPSGETVLSAPEDVVTAFLADSFALVPAGAESDHLDLDSELARIRDLG
ncbi:SsgA family sporulation/cell division regulator [Kitasatospora sp. MAA19]|uniref:SsgA family sporulation/cell division regulator n=1 Tax=Kitasatospora sp. MAA19 TaxID=3035090 RepID=UPI0024757DBE|nr:SsgA family sporulation/cell division regulator [Kitasatospora sp. MAA19]